MDHLLYSPNLYLIFDSDWVQNNVHKSIHNDILILHNEIFHVSNYCNFHGGNIGSILGARLASGLHVGNISLDIKDKKMHENLTTSIILGLITYGILAILIYYVALFSEISMDIGLIEFILILLSVGILLIFIVTFASILTAFLSFKRGLDPDDFVAPIVTTISDTMGIIFLFFIIGVVIL